MVRMNDHGQMDTYRPYIHKKKLGNEKIDKVEPVTATWSVYDRGDKI